jgi:hypothetical protein
MQNIGPGSVKVKTCCSTFTMEISHTDKIRGKKEHMSTESACTAASNNILIAGPVRVNFDALLL